MVCKRDSKYEKEHLINITKQITLRDVSSREFLAIIHKKLFKQYSRQNNIIVAKISAFVRPAIKQV